MNIYVSPLFESLLHSASLLCETYVIPALLTEKNAKRIFAFTKRYGDVKIFFSVCFAAAATEAAGSPSN